MKMIKKLALVALAAVIAALTIIPATLAVSWSYPSLYGQPRIGAYTSVTMPNQGMYNYLAPPTALTRYGAQYHVSNIRGAVYPENPFAYSATLYRPYFGYPYGVGGSPYRVGYTSSGVFGGGGSSRHSLNRATW